MMNGLSIIIPTRGYSFNLQYLLHSIKSQQGDFAREVILIVNAESSLPYEQLKEKLSQTSDEWAQLQMKLIYIDRPGVNRARNAGILAAQFELLVFLDDDCELSSKNLLQLHFQHHLKNLALFALGGLYHLESHAKYFDRLYNVLQMRWLYEGVKHEEGFRSHYLIGVHFSVKASFLEEYKITFNDTIIYGGSELEFFYKPISMT